MAWKALVPPRLGTQDATGMCLRFAQSFFGAPVRYASAWEAWQHVQGKYSPSDPLPDVPVLLWFEHWGTYGSPPTYGNWGHVAAYVPGDAIYTSPAGGYGQGKYATIPQIEAAFNCRYVGWSTDINGLLVAGWTAPKPIVEDDMYENADRDRDKITYDRLVNMEKLLISHDKRDQITYKRLVNMEGALIRTLAGVTKLTTIAEGAKDVSPEVLATAKQIAADVEKALQDEFAAIPGAVADEQSKRLKA